MLLGKIIEYYFGLPDMTLFKFIPYEFTCLLIFRNDWKRLDSLVEEAHDLECSHFSTSHYYGYLSLQSLKYGSIQFASTFPKYLAFADAYIMQSIKIIIRRRDIEDVGPAFLQSLIEGKTPHYKRYICDIYAYDIIEHGTLSMLSTMLDFNVYYDYGALYVFAVKCNKPDIIRYLLKTGKIPPRMRGQFRPPTMAPRQ